EAVPKLILDPGRDSSREKRPRPSDPESDRVHRRTPSLSAKHADRLPRDLIHLERADHANGIARKNLGVALGIDPLELGAERIEPFPCDALLEALPDRIIPLGAFEKPLEERPQIESRAAHHEREMYARLDFMHGLASIPRVAPGAVGLGG